MDREKIIKEFELFIKEFHPACTSEGVELDMFIEVLALLKEQEAVVRCRDCKWFDGEVCEVYGRHTGNFFCADGERKEGR